MGPFPEEHRSPLATGGALHARVRKAAEAAENPMNIINGLLAELEQEAQTTRRVLERIPQAHLSWKPHPKSMSLGQLALHVAIVPGLVAELAAVDTVPEPSSFVQPEAASSAELVPALENSVSRRRRRSAESTTPRWPRRGKSSTAIAK